MASASSQTPRPQLSTFADLLAIPAEQRFHEVLDGEVVAKLMPSGRHGLTQNRMGRLLDPFDRKANGPARPGGWWFLSEVEIELARHQVVRPDLAGWRRDRMPVVPEDYPLRLRPDWVCEVLTDGQGRRRDGIQKRRIYADHEVPHYWIVDTERRQLTVLRLSERGYVEVLEAGAAQRVRAEPFDSLELPVGVLFGEDTD